MSDSEDGSLWRAGLGVVLLLTNLVVAVAAGVAIALRGIVWLPDALVGIGLAASNALAELLGFKLRE